ncbi:hypothetical protein ACFE04_026867 [Oxalis oulophora]
MAISLLLQRRLLSLTSLKPHYHFTLLTHFSTSTTTTTTAATTTTQQPKPTSLSDRMKFVFDQIDSIESQRTERHETLQKIKAWRQKSKPTEEIPQQSISTVPFQEISEPIEVLGQDSGGLAELDESDSTELVKDGKEKECEVELVHPWPEWIELMDRLVHQNYFDHKRRDDDKMVRDLGFETVEESSKDVGIDFMDFKTVQSAFVNFGKDRFDIMRSLSRKDIQILVGFGCPSTDKKAVFSSKLLRKFVHLDEGDVCSSCSLRSTCERGYLITNKEDEARTIDVMRVLLSFGFDPVKGMSTNKSIMKQKSVKTIVRKLLHEIVKLSAVPIDPNLPPPVIRKPPPKVKIPPPTPKRRVGRDDVEMKKGDWLCPKCDFMNFAKNTKCLQCDAKRPKRQLLPGEWECPGCNFLNYRRNMACFHCDAKRPPDEFTEMKQQESQNGGRSRTMLDRPTSRPEVSNAWNFDFDDDESDGADVAAFEYADSPTMDEQYPVDSQAHRVPEDNFSTPRRPMAQEREYSNINSSKPGLGFDDFDDEDDVDSYEIDIQPKNTERKPYIDDFSEDEGFSDSDLPVNGRQSNFKNKKISLTESDDDGDFDSRKDISNHPKWKSSHVADSRLRSRGRGSFGSDEELELDSDDDDDDFSSMGKKGNKFSSGRGEFQKRRSSNFKERSFSDSESDDDFPRSRRSKAEPGRRGKDSGRGPRGDYNNFDRDTRSRANGKFGDRRKSLDNNDFDRSSRGSGRDDRRFSGNDREMHDRGNDRFGDRRKSFNNDDFDRSSRGSGCDDRRFSGNDRGNGRFGDRRKSFNDNNFDRSSRGSGRDDRRFSGNDRKMNDRGNDRFGDRRKSFDKNDFDRPSRGSGRDDKRFSGNDWKKNDSGPNDTNPRRERSRTPRSNDHDMDTDHGNRRRYNKR